VTRRHPVVGFFLILVLSALAYGILVHHLEGWARNAWFQEVTRRLVVDRSALSFRDGPGFGMYRPEFPWNLERYQKLSDSLGVDGRIVSWYQSWGDGPESEFKDEAVNKVLGRGQVPMITWEPWTTAFQGHRGDTVGSLTRLVAGDFDPYIRRWARAVAKVHQPILLRPLHEMGNPWYLWSMPHGNSPETIAESWRHIVRIFREEGAKNAAFVWTPHIVADTMAWPGAEWVDWIGLDVFNYGTLSEGGHWLGFQQLLVPQLTAVRDLGRPVMIAEVGTSDDGGDRSDWWRDAFQRLPQEPEIRAMVIFDDPACMNTTGFPVNWGLPHQHGEPAVLRAAVAASGFSKRPR